MFSIAGGDDAGDFTIDPHTGALKFIQAPDFEKPQDSNGNNVYEVVVAATDFHGAVSQQSIDVTVTDARERGKAPVGWHDDSHRAFTFDMDFGGKMSAPGHQQTIGIEHHPFADIHAMMEAAHTLAADAATQADAGHNPMLEHFLPHQPNAHDALLG